MSTKFDEVIAKVVKEHFAELEDHSSLCIVHQISTPLSEKIFLEISGLGKAIEYQNHRSFFELVRFVLNAIDNNFVRCDGGDLVKSWSKLFHYVINKLQSYNASDCTLLKELKSCNEVTLEEKAIMILAFIRAGIENPRSFIVSAIVRYYEHKQLYYEDRIAFLNEVMRYDCPAKITARYISQDTTIGNIQLKQGYKVWTSFRLANFYTTSSDNFVFNIQKKANLSLGVGPHYCIGKDLTYKLTLAVLDRIIDIGYQFNLEDLQDYKLDNSLVFRRYVEPLIIYKDTL